MKNNKKWAKLMKFEENKMQNLYFLKIRFFDFLATQKCGKSIFQKMQILYFFLLISSFLFIFCYFSRFLLPKSISFIKILILCCRLKISRRWPCSIAGASSTSSIRMSQLRRNVRLTILIRYIYIIYF